MQKTYRIAQYLRNLDLNDYYIAELGFPGADLGPAQLQPNEKLKSGTLFSLSLYLYAETTMLPSGSRQIRNIEKVLKPVDFLVYEKGLMNFLDVEALKRRARIVMSAFQIYEEPTLVWYNFVKFVFENDFATTRDRFSIDFGAWLKSNY